MVWNNASVFQDFIEVFRNNWCEYNISAYTKVRFRMRSSVAGKRVVENRVLQTADEAAIAASARLWQERLK